MDNQKIAIEILPLIGGKENISHLTHCITRLRITLNSFDNVDKEAISNIPGVLGVNENSGQLQIVLGNRVSDVFDAMKSLVYGSKEPQETEDTNTNSAKKGIVANLLDAIAGIFSPVIPAIVGAGLLKGIIVMLTSFNLVHPDSETIKILSVIGDSAFYFLPVILGVSSAIKFKCNPYIGAALGGILIHPQLTALMQSSGDYMHLFDIPLKSTIYMSSVLPIILTIWFMSYVEKGLATFIPKSLKGVFQPVLTLIIVAPVMLAVLGPVGSVIGNVVASTFILIYNHVGFLAGALLGGFYGPIVITGMHYGFLPVMFESISQTGFDYIMAIGIAANSAQAGATFMVFLMTKSKTFKSIAGGAAVNAVIGITEPALFGVTVRLKKPLIAACIGGALGGAVMGLFQVGATGIGTGPLAGLAFFFGPKFIYFIIGCLVSFISAALLTRIFGFEDVKQP
ncbi:PTS transporter subunit EIIC [Vibrio sp.]|uniref:PTS sugar transporter subunit IIC n=1 Tax=Vibrio viridaestus TaxID=2487322 RepID=A0A3N9U4J6_9VIBR|nr:PTS transporter subunit EIIC [Vibrio viridaestus]MDC0611752.1 PTS transporter subunit EIIC [Vibrio sp.]RQW64532.1 PTS sugar transporter subunit IIC [Vibrio viridaestus]